MDRILISVTVSLLVIPFALAGSAADPEMTDPPGDTTDEVTQAPISAPGADLRSAWIAEGADRWQIHVRVTDLGPAQLGIVENWKVTFSVDGTTMTGEAQRSIDGLVISLSSPGKSGPTSFTGEATGTADAAADEITMDFPRTFDLTDPGSTDHVEFAPGTGLSSPRATSAQGRGTSDTGLLLLQVDETAPGRDFVFSVPMPRYPVFSGNAPGDPINTKSVIADGTPLLGQGSGSFATLRFVAGNPPKTMTFNGGVVPLDDNDAVTLSGYSGSYDVTSGRIKFEGSAASYQIT